jgi:hypothetical protein
MVELSFVDSEHGSGAWNMDSAGCTGSYGFTLVFQSDPVVAQPEFVPPIGEAVVSDDACDYANSYFVLSVPPAVLVNGIASRR